MRSYSCEKASHFLFLPYFVYHLGSFLYYLAFPQEETEQEYINKP